MLAINTMNGPIQFHKTVPLSSLRKTQSWDRSVATETMNNQYQTKNILQSGTNSRMHWTTAMLDTQQLKSDTRNITIRIQQPTVNVNTDCVEDYSVQYFLIILRTQRLETPNYCLNSNTTDGDVDYKLEFDNQNPTTQFLSSYRKPRTNNARR